MSELRFCEKNPHYSENQRGLSSTKHVYNKKMKRKQSKTRPQSSCYCLGFSAETLLSKCVELTELSLPPLHYPYITDGSPNGQLAGRLSTKLFSSDVLKRWNRITANCRLDCEVVSIPHKQRSAMIHFVWCVIFYTEKWIWKCIQRRAGNNVNILPSSVSHCAFVYVRVKAHGM